MDWSTIAKYGAGGTVLASVYVLVWLGKADVSIYLGLATAALAALGVNVTSTPKPPAQP